MVVQLFSVLGSFVSSLLSIEIIGISMAGWFALFWILAIIGWILQVLYGGGGKE